jgi:hypothetical protein
MAKIDEIPRLKIDFSTYKGNRFAAIVILRVGLKNAAKYGKEAEMMARLKHCSSAEEIFDLVRTYKDLSGAVPALPPVKTNQEIN